MGRTKGSKNKKTLIKEGLLPEKEVTKLEQKEQKQADKSFDDLVERAKERGALINIKTI